MFFKQKYTPQQVHDQINNITANCNNFHDVQKQLLRLFDDTIQPQYAGFIIFNDEGKLQSEVNIGKYPSHALALEDFLLQLTKCRQKVTKKSDIKSDQKNMKEYFELGHIGLILKLKSNDKLVGFMIFGNKKNGRPYSASDTKFIASTADNISHALQNSQQLEELQVSKKSLQEKLNKTTSALKRTQDKLTALEDTKDEFISMTSHQLRTPLTSIKGYISMMLEGDLGKISPTQRKALEEAFGSSQRMVFLISDFLNVSRIRTGNFMIEKSETDLNQIIQEEIAQLKDMAGLREQTIKYNVSKNFPKVMLDESKIRQVMMNIIDNAIFYTPKNGRIDINLTKTDTEIRFEVTDTGIGVPKNVQHRLFTKFFRAENGRNARPDGTGLGLFLAQKIVDAHGGKVIFHSLENKGSTFGFRFPLEIIKNI